MMSPYTEFADWPYIGTPLERALLFRDELYRSALAYAEAGYTIFPVNEKKLPLVKWGKGEDNHPNIRKRRATTDKDTIRAWWRKWPLAGIAMPTGKLTGVTVLDIDRKNGVDGLAALKAIGIDALKLSNVVARTPSGGFHVYLKHEPGTRNSASVIAEGVDVRGEGGMIILPPTLKALNLDEYQWEVGYERLI